MDQSNVVGHAYHPSLGLSDRVRRIACRVVATAGVSGDPRPFYRDVDYWFGPVRVWSTHRHLRPYPARSGYKIPCPSCGYAEVGD